MYVLIKLYLASEFLKQYLREINIRQYCNMTKNLNSFNIGLIQQYTLVDDIIIPDSMLNVLI